MQRSEQCELSEQEKQRVIDEAQNDIREITEQLRNPASFVNKIFQTEKKEIINFWAEKLELIYSLQDRPLITIANDIVKELQKIGVKYGDDGRYTYAYDVLPAKFKGHIPNPSEDDLSDIRQNLQVYIEKQDLRAENMPIIKRIMKSVELLEKCATELESTHCLSNMDADRREQFLIEECGQWDAVNSTLEDVMDKRQSVPEHYLGSFYKCYAEYGVSGTATKFYFYSRKEIEDITQKQSTKTGKGLISRVPRIYDPENFVDAIKGEWYGVQCEGTKPSCGSWRMKEVQESTKSGLKRWVLKCYRCNRTCPVRKRPFPGQVKKQQEIHTDIHGNVYSVAMKQYSTEDGK